MSTIKIEEARSIARHLSAHQPDVQVAQTRFRMQLVEAWKIPVGARVLEIGCGQGDTTAVLAHAVGDSGHVTAVDSAAPDYGSPFTIGGATKRLLTTPLGRRIDFRLAYDVLHPAHDFAPDSFDCVVLAHCSWYFASLDQLRRTLQRIRPWARTLCFSEWEMQPRTYDQVAHLLAVLIQGQIQAYNDNSISNVRTPFSRARLTRLLAETGWTISEEATMDTTALQDADWEIVECLRSSGEEAATLALPPRLRELLDSQIDTLRSVASNGNNRPLPSYALVATRSPSIEAVNQGNSGVIL